MGFHGDVLVRVEIDAGVLRVECRLDGGGIVSREGVGLVRGGAAPATGAGFPTAPGGRRAGGGIGGGRMAAKVGRDVGGGGGGASGGGGGRGLGHRVSP